MEEEKKAAAAAQVKTQALVGAALVGKVIEKGWMESPLVIDLDAVLAEVSRRGGLAYLASREEAVVCAGELVAATQRHLGQTPSLDLHADLALATLYGDAYDALLLGAAP